LLISIILSGQANGALQSQIEALENEPSAYIAASDKKAELLSDKGKFQQLVQGRIVSFYRAPVMNCVLACAMGK
jgi:hypothetical protein